MFLLYIDIATMLRKLALQLHFTKSLKRDKVYKFCLGILEEHIGIVSTP